MSFKDSIAVLIAMILVAWFFTALILWSGFKMGRYYEREHPQVVR